MGSLAGKVAVVAGGAQGIGASTARKLAHEGVKVVVGDIDAAALQRLVDDVMGDDGAIKGIPFDISKEASVKGLFDAAVDAYGGVDLLFNVAADQRPEVLGRDFDIVEIDLATWDHTHAVNLRGFVLTLRCAIPLMLARGGGAIVQTSSGASFAGEPRRVAYATAKAAINALTRHVANRWGPEGIRCNTVAPGMIDAHPERGSKFTPEMTSRLSLRRVGTPEEIADGVLFLLSDEASYINGQVLSIDGGGSMR